MDLPLARLDSDVYMRPVRIFPDPFRDGDNVIVLCETLLLAPQADFFNMM